MEVFDERSQEKWAKAAKVMPVITDLQRQIDELRGADGG
jgi:hypothetical protein